MVGTKRIATMHRKLAERVCRTLPLTSSEVPFEIPPIRQAVQWHLTNRNDAAIQWVVGQLCRVAAENFTRRLSTAEDKAHGEISVAYQATLIAEKD